jgi:site-specific recombinase XerD
MPKVRRFSPKSVEAYKCSLNSYIDFLTNECNIPKTKISFDDFRREQLKAYIVWLTEKKHYAPKTTNLRMTAIKSFLKYCAEEDISLVCFHSDAKNLRLLKEVKKPIRYLSKNATTALLRAIPAETAKGRRNRLLLILMYDSAARVQELADLSLSDLHLNISHPFVTLTGKGSKTRNVPLMKKTVSHLREYLKEFHCLDNEAPLFFSNRNGIPHALSTDSISLILKKAAEYARRECDDIPDDIHCHLIRKTRAMDLYQEGVSLPIVMQILGHESIGTTTGFYAFATMEMICSELEKANPQAAEPIPKWKEKAYLDVLYSLD